jgi:hypothetical protein
MIYRLLGLASLVMAILAISEVANGPKPFARKVAWIVLILFAPFLGAVLYYLVGRE